MAEKNSLWKNIRKKAEQNRRTGAKPKKPTAEMLRQERKIKAKKYAEGGETDPPYRPLGIPMEGYEPDSVFYETPTKYSEPKQEAKPKPVNKKEDKPKPTSKRSEVQDYYLNQYLNQNSSTPKPDRYIAERDASSTKLSPAMSTKEWQEGPRDFNIVKGIQVALDLGQMAPHPFIAGGSYLASLPFTTYDVLDDLSKDDYKQAAVDALGYIPKLKNVGSLNTVIDATSLYNDVTNKANGGPVGDDSILYRKPSIPMENYEPELENNFDFRTSLKRPGSNQINLHLPEYHSKNSTALDFNPYLTKINPVPNVDVYYGGADVDLNLLNENNNRLDLRGGLGAGIVKHPGGIEYINPQPSVGLSFRRRFAEGGQYLTVDGEYHRVYRNADGDIAVNHPKEDKGKWDTINLTDKSGANTIAEGVASVRKWHRENPSYAQGGIMYPDGGKTKVYTDPKEFKKAKKDYSDSLFLASNNITFPTQIHNAYLRNFDFPSQQQTYVNTIIPVSGVEVNDEWTNTLNTRIKPTSFEPALYTSHSYPMTRAKYSYPKLKPILGKPTVDKLQSKQYSNFSSNQQPSIVGNIENIQPSEINMDKFYEGQYEKYRRSPYEDPMYRVWVPGQQMQIVPEEQFKKLNEQYALKDLEQKAQGGYINPYMYYASGPMYYGDGGKIWKHIGAGAYGVLEGGLDTLTFGATDKLTDKGFDWLTKVGNKNLDLNDPKNAKFLRTQQQIRGYSNVAGAIGTAAFTGQWGSAIGQSAKGVNTAFQATEGLSDDFKKWSNIGSQAIGIGAGLAGGSLNVESASKAGQAAANFGSQVGKFSPYVNQGLGMIGGNQQSLLEQAEARQDYLNSPEYLAMKEKQNQAYVNQGLSFASTGGNINNSLNLQNSMRGKYNSYKRKYSKGGTFQKFGINEIPDSAGYHHENAYGGVPIGPNAMAEGGEFVLDNNYVVSDEVDGMNTQTDEFGRTMAQNLKRDLSKYTMRDLNSKNRDSLRRPMDPLAEQTINQIKQKAMMETEMARAEAQAKEQERQAMVDGALQYAAAGGKLNEDITKIVKEEYAAAYGGYINPKKYKGLNMPYSSGGKLPKEVLRARVESHMSPEEADSYVENYAKGGSIHIKESKKGTFTAAAKKRGKSVQEFARQVLANKGNYSSAMVKKANFARNAAGWKHAHGGPVVSNVNQDFDLYAQNRGGMMMARGGNMYAMGGPDGEFGPITEAQAIASGWQPQYQDEIDYTQMPDIRYTIPPVETIQSINNLQSTIQTPKIIGNIQDIPTYYNQPSSFKNSDGEIPIINPIDFGSDLNYNNGQYTIKSKGMPGIVGDIQPMPSVSKVDVSDSTTPWYEEPLYSKAARYGQAIPGVIASITALQNKKRKLPYRKLDAQTVNYEPERIIDREESRRRFNTFADRMKNIASNAGMLAGNLRGTLLGSNKELAGRIAESVMREKNTNAQLAQQAAMTQFGADRETDAFNEQMFQNAQTQAIAGLQDTTGKLAGAAGEERKQYLQEWIAKNKLKTRDFIQGPDGSYYYEGPDGTLTKV